MLSHLRKVNKGQLETTKLFFKYKRKDVDSEMLEFLTYIEQSTDEVANASKSQLVKEINKKVTRLKEDKSMEEEYMTLLERDREKFQEGREEGREEGKKEAARALLDLLDDETIASRIGLPLEEVKALRKE